MFFFKGEEKGKIEESTYREGSKLEVAPLFDDVRLSVPPASHQGSVCLNVVREPRAMGPGRIGSGGNGFWGFRGFRCSVGGFGVVVRSSLCRWPGDTLCLMCCGLVLSCAHVLVGAEAGVAALQKKKKNPKISLKEQKKGSQNRNEATEATPGPPRYQYAHILWPAV